eukprot:269952_1
MADRKYRQLRVCKVGTVPLSIMEYSYCIRDAFIELFPDMFPYKTEFKRIEKYRIDFGSMNDRSLMTLCLDMALFIQSPNDSYRTHIQYIKQTLKASITRHYGYLFASSQSLIQDICQCIEGYVVDVVPYKWTYSADDQESNSQFELYEKESICQTTDVMTSDAVCVALSPNISLDYKDIICFQIYCLGKGDEMWIGICNEDNFGDDQEERATDNRITYYGGRKGSNDKNDFWDGAYGAIHGMKQLMQTHLEEYGEGDWLTIMIDTFRHKMTFFKNRRFQSAIMYKQYRKELGNNTVFYVVLDDVFDGLFIERVVHFGSVWKKVYSAK